MGERNQPSSINDRLRGKLKVTVVTVTRIEIDLASKARPIQNIENPLSGTYREGFKLTMDSKSIAFYQASYQVRSK